MNYKAPYFLKGQSTMEKYLERQIFLASLAARDKYYPQCVDTLTRALDAAMSLLATQKADTKIDEAPTDPLTAWKQSTDGAN